VTHLGDALSALVDGELSGAELDRANAHLAACPACQAEAGALRVLKDELRTLAQVHDDGTLTARLLALAFEDAPGPAVRQETRQEAARRLPGRPVAAGRPGAARPRSVRPPGRPRRRGRYVLWGTVSLVIAGIGTAAFGLGGGEGAPEPQISPPIGVFDMQHAVSSGDVPFADPARRTVRVPASARP
jgi:anti-sigma factor RsiW